MSPKSSDKCLHKKSGGARGRHIKGESCVKMKAEVRVMPPQAKEHQELPATSGS